MVVILDTNVLLQSLARKNKFRPIWDAFLREDFVLAMSVSIKYEYEEKLVEKTSVEYASLIMQILERAVNVTNKKTYYYWNIIKADPDDNKFFDAAVAANTDYLVTNDLHFNEAKKIQFPKVTVITADEFLGVLKNMPL